MTPVQGIVLILAIILTAVALLASSLWRTNPKLPSHDPNLPGPHARPVDDGYWAYEFPELHLSVTVPCVLKDSSGDVPQSLASRTQKYLAYDGRWSGMRFLLAAYSTRRPAEPEKQAHSDLQSSRMKAGYVLVGRTFKPTQFLGFPACKVTSRYMQGERPAGSEILYFATGNTMYYLRINYWESAIDSAEKHWDEILGSVRLNQVTATRSPNG